MLRSLFDFISDRVGTIISRCKTNIELLEKAVKKIIILFLLHSFYFVGVTITESSMISRYAGPKYLFPDEDYPNYLSGSGYCMSKDVATKLLDAAMTTPVFHLEDVYLTGNVTF